MFFELIRNLLASPDVNGVAGFIFSVNDAVTKYFWTF